MQRITRDQLIGLDSSGLPAAATVRSGEQLVTETIAATVSPFLTGPIEVDGLNAGDSLAVTIDDIDVQGPGWIGFAGTRLAWEPWGGVLRDQAVTSVERTVEADNHLIRLSPSVSLPSRLMVGWIGLILPSYEADPWDHGGNLDTRTLGVGSTLYLHDETGAGRFLIGDVHAAMGDGEVSGAGVEIAADVTISVKVIKETRPHRPMVSHAAGLSHLCSRFVESESYRQCIFDAALHVAYSQGVSFGEANAWLGAIGDLRVSSVVAHTPTYRMDVPHEVLRPAEELLREVDRTRLPSSPRPS
ncbi:acetamidase/formamidase family protein [Microlunatus sp. GCM10028923]|uniref:acetamidase/formamidase family protein n=1 Tax=Microlunatus sp. GCM10028923 TaxID=3273400 RepID=UPI00360EFC8C